MKRPFEALPIRYVHDVRTGEFLNIGVLVVSADRTFVRARFLSRWARVTATFPGVDVVVLRRIASAFERQCATWSNLATGAVSLLARSSVRELFASVIVVDDSAIQAAPTTISGVSADLERTLDELFALYVGGDRAAEKASRDDGDVWRDLANAGAVPAELRVHEQPHVIRTRHYDLTLDHAWKNTRWHAAVPLSFDLADPRRILHKATDWTGRVAITRPQEQGTTLYLLVGMPSAESEPGVRQAGADALEILEENVRGQAFVVQEGESGGVLEGIARALREHNGG